MISKEAVVPLRGFNQQRFPEALVKDPFAPSIDRSSSSASWTPRRKFRSLVETCGTGTSTGRLMIAMHGGQADVERDLIGTRTAEGRRRAKAQGKHMGRPPSLTPSQRKETRRGTQGATLQELAQSYNVGITTIRRVTRPA